MRTPFAFAVILSAFWLINSGYFKPLLLGLGVVSVVIVLALVWRMKDRDGEVFPIFMPSVRLPAYLAWMIGQIVLSNIDVAKRVWKGKGSISPTIVTIRADQKSDVGRVMFANSITMTPGTLTLSVHDDVFEVHALTAQAAEELRAGPMGRKVAELEGR